MTWSQLYDITVIWTFAILIECDYFIIIHKNVRLHILFLTLHIIVLIIFLLLSYHYEITSDPAYLMPHLSRHIAYANHLKVIKLVLSVRFWDHREDPSENMRLLILNGISAGNIKYESPCICRIIVHYTLTMTFTMWLIIFL